MLCVLMIAGGYALLPVAAPCDDPRCLRIDAPAGFLSPHEIPAADWIVIRDDQPLLFCLAKSEK